MSPDDPRHGTSTGYWRGCRETCCRRAHARDINLWRMGRTQSDVPSLGTRRRIEALMALGWSRAQICARMGHHRDYLAKVLVRDMIEPTTVAKVKVVYEQMCMTLPPESSAVAKTRNLARRRGFAFPLAWDDIDDPAEQPKGVRSATPFDDDRLDRILELDEMRTGIDEVCAALGIGRDALWKWCDKQGRRDLYARISGRTRTMPNQWTGVA